jgi:phosphopantothenoylcysteine decarboxylase/phosphopantothenate--cysteine ligase
MDAMTDQTDGTNPQACIVLGVTGSIAAYKAADLTSRLVQAGLDVHVLMTKNATNLVQPQTFLTLSRNAVTTDLWDVPNWRPEHIALADQADLLVVVPASANFIGKLAHGIADDALSTYALSHTGPVILAPAMNPRMWGHDAVQENLAILRRRGVVIVEPEEGRVACGEDGKGRLASVGTIQRAIQVHFALGRLPMGSQTRKILITAGPTREALDPVRFLTNRSTGKMGYALAEVACAAGHEVVLVSGPVSLPRPAGCRIVDVVSAAEMAAAVKAEFASADLLIMCAAVADYRPVHCEARKLKKGDSELALPLCRTEDILGTLATAKSPRQKIMGFAAETHDMAQHAQAKLRAKKLDWIVANDVSRGDIGFGGDCNEAIVYPSDGEPLPFPRMSKLELAARLLQLATEE